VAGSGLWTAWPKFPVRLHVTSALRQAIVATRPRGAGGMWGRRGRIFISYRRDDAPGEARNIHDRLARRFGASRVFMDVDDLFAGQRFDVELEKALAGCDVLLVVIGLRWADTLSEHMSRDERDYVREEIAAALGRGIRIIPALVGHEGRMPSLPRRNELPNDIRDFVLFQKQSLMHESFSRDATQLIEAIKEIRSRGTPRRSVVSWVAAGSTAMAAILLYFADVRLTALFTPPIVASGQTGQPAEPVQLSVGQAGSSVSLPRGTEAPTSTGPVLQSEPVSAPVPMHFVQLSSHRSEAAARGGFANQKHQYPDLLGDWEVTIARADLGSPKGVWYRSRLGPFSKEAEATAFCGRLRAARIECQFPPPP
jgi:hypothetical protein